VPSRTFAGHHEAGAVHRPVCDYVEPFNWLIAIYFSQPAGSLRSRVSWSDGALDSMASSWCQGASPSHRAHSFRLGCAPPTMGCPGPSEGAATLRLSVGRCWGRHACDSARSAWRVADSSHRRGAWPRNGVNAAPGSPHSSRPPYRTERTQPAQAQRRRRVGQLEQLDDHRER
jgi:hypothetical protein